MLETLKRTAGSLAKRRGVVKVGWLLQADKAGFIWEAPRRFSRDLPAAASAKSVQNCPAVLEYEASFFEIPCPIDAHLRVVLEGDKPHLINVDGEHSTVRRQYLERMVHIMKRSEWRNPQRPVIQILTPYTFVADESVVINQMPPLLHYRTPAWPGLPIGGRFPVHLWPRQLMWAFEWFDVSQDLVLRRGEPWFYVRFDTLNPSKQVKLVEAELTDELQEYFQGMAAVTNYVRRTFSLFRIAEERRPAQLLVERRR